MFCNIQHEKSSLQVLIRTIMTTTVIVRGGVRSTRGLGPTMTVRGQSIGILIAMLPQTFWGDMGVITVQKTSKYYTM